MQTSPVPLTHKLILGVLVLILAALGLLIARTYRTERGTMSQAVSGTADSRLAAPPKTDAPVAPWKTNTSRAVPTNRLIFQPAKTSSTSTSPAVADTPEPPAPPPIGETIVSPVVLQDARSAFGAKSPDGILYTGPASFVGRVTLRGQPLPEAEIEMGPTCGPLHKEPVTTRHYVVSPNGGLANVLIFVHPVSPTAGAGIDDLVALPMEGQAPLEGSVLLDQKGCMFQPYVTAMHLNQVLAVRNSDATLHNVHLTPRRNKEVNFGQPGRQENRFRRFEFPEAFIRIKCDVHPWMFAYVSVLPHPYFAISTAPNGDYRIPANVPAGNYVVTAHHLKLGTQSREVTFPTSRVDFEFNISEVSRQAPIARPRL